MFNPPVKYERHLMAKYCIFYLLHFWPGRKRNFRVKHCRSHKSRECSGDVFGDSVVLNVITHRKDCGVALPSHASFLVNALFKIFLKIAIRNHFILLHVCLFHRKIQISLAHTDLPDIDGTLRNDVYDWLNVNTWLFWYFHSDIDILWKYHLFH